MDRWSGTVEINDKIDCSYIKTFQASKFNFIITLKEGIEVHPHGETSVEFNLNQDEASKLRDELNRFLLK